MLCVTGSLGCWSLALGSCASCPWHCSWRGRDTTNARASGSSCPSLGLYYLPCYCSRRVGYWVR